MSGIWRDLADGWQDAETRLKLAGWSQDRRCVFLRRPAKPQTLSRPELPPQTEFEFVQVLADGPNCEYMGLVTNTEQELEAVAQLYRDRADCEDVFDEIKNQWGWAGYVTRDLRRCRILARLIALVYNGGTSLRDWPSATDIWKPSRPAPCSCVPSADSSPPAGVRSCD